MDVDEDIEKDVNTAVDADDGLYFDCCCLSCHHWCVVCAIVNGIFESESMGSTIFHFFLIIFMNPTTWIGYLFMRVPPLMRPLIA